MEVMADCEICKNHTNVIEVIRDKNGEQRVIFICDECIDWLKELISE